MAATERFYFEPGFSLRAAGTGDEVRLLNRFRNTFEVGVTARENWVELSGDDANVAVAVSALRELQELFILRGRELERSDAETILRRKNREPVHALWEARVTVGPGKREILPRSAKQKAYLEAIRKQDMVFGIGPAGTGKTYLAMAMAVNMFLKGEVSRTHFQFLTDGGNRGARISLLQKLSGSHLNNLQSRQSPLVNSGHNTHPPVYT